MVKKSEPSAPPMYPNLDEVQHVPQIQQAEDEGKTFRLKRISDIREILKKEVETRGRYRRRYKSVYNTAIYVNAGAGLTRLLLRQFQLPLLRQQELELLHLCLLVF